MALTTEQKKNCKNLVYVDRMVEHFNQLAFWVENFILLRDKPKHRALMLEKFMKIELGLNRKIDILLPITSFMFTSLMLGAVLILKITIKDYFLNLHLRQK